MREAILAANGQLGPDNIRFDFLYGGIIQLNSSLPTVTDDLSIQNSRGISPFTISGNELHQILSIGEQVSVEISDLTI